MSVTRDCVNKQANRLPHLTRQSMAMIVNMMRKLLPALLCLPILVAAPPFQASFDTTSKQWEALRGAAAPDEKVQHAQRNALRVEPSGASDARIQSTPVTLAIGKRYELSGWVRTEKLAVRDL